MPRGRNGSISMIMPRERPLLMLMDGHALVHRAWHAIQQPLTVQRTGEEVRAVFGFTNTFLKAIQEWNPTHCAIAFDLPTPTFRHIRYQEYKSQRPEAPPELRQQFQRVRQLMRAFAIPIFEIEGYEADDVLGTLCRQAEEKGIETIILTGDTDTLQLVSPLVRVVLHYRVQERKVYDEAEVRAKYGGLSPSQQPDLKALKGDPSDNIPGVPGVGEKTAFRLLLEFGSIEGIYENIDRVNPPQLREALLSHREQVMRGKELTSIVTDLPITLDLEACRFWRYDRRQVIDLFRELEFFSLVGKVPQPTEPEEVKAPAVTTEAPPLDYRVVSTPDALEALSRELKGGFVLDVESTGTDPMAAELVGLSFSTAPGRAWYVPIAHRGASQLPLENLLRALGPLLEDPGIPKVAHNGNYDLTLLANYGVPVRGLAFDTMVAAHLLGRKSLGLKALALDILGEEMTPITALIGTGRKQLSMAEVPLEEAVAYACADADLTGRIRDVLEKELQREGLWDLFTQVEMPLVPVLVTMQRNGVALDRGVLEEMSRSLAEQLRELEAHIYDLVGHAFNINSPQQLSEVLFGELKLTKTKRTKTGYSTDAAALEGLRGTHPVVDRILEYRQLSKLKSTYVDALPQMINRRTGRLHTSFNQTGAATGRISSSEPNLQNIPVRTELGRQVRKAFVAEGAPRWLLLSADYSQIELRVLAHLSRDPGLVSAFQRGEDIHTATAAQIYAVPPDQVTPDMRRIAKVMNFGVIYGLSPYGISQQTELTTEEGHRFIESYFSKYPGIRDYLENTKEQARTLGYVETLLGRRRYIPEINSSNAQVRQAAERMAVNMPVQGTAADIMKLAMIRVHRRLEREGLRAKLILQVHDELMFELPVEETEVLKGIVLEEMPSALKLAVPLKVDIKTGYTWGDME
jgi:DNA polymerase-1